MVDAIDLLHVERGTKVRDITVLAEDAAHDRKKELIIAGGCNVHPREIEEVLYEHPAVQETALIGIPQPALNERVGAAVALKPGGVITGVELRDYVKANAAAYKSPRHVWLVSELPKRAAGKILRREIRLPPELAGAAPGGRS